MFWTSWHCILHIAHWAYIVWHSYAYICHTWAEWPRKTDSLGIWGCLPPSLCITGVLTLSLDHDDQCVAFIRDGLSCFKTRIAYTHVFSHLVFLVFPILNRLGSKSISLPLFSFSIRPLSSRALLGCTTSSWPSLALIRVQHGHRWIGLFHIVHILLRLARCLNKSLCIWNALCFYRRHIIDSTIGRGLGPHAITV